MPSGKYKRTKKHRDFLSKLHRNKIVSRETREKVSNSMVGHVVSDDTKEKIRKSRLGMKFSSSHKHNISLSKIGNKCRLGLRHSEETKAKMSAAHRPAVTEETKLKIRCSIIDYIEKTNGIRPSIGINESSFLDNQEKLDRCKIQRNYHIKELGYFVDGYCKETNTVYEIYEKYHDGQVQRDLDRETEICNCLSCDFIILYDRSH